MYGEDVLAIGAEQHEISLPMPGLFAICRRGWAFGQRNPIFNGMDGAGARSGAMAAPGFGLPEIMAPSAIVGAAHLGIDEAINRLVTDPPARLLVRPPASDLLGRPSHRKAVEHVLLQLRLARQTRTAPAPGFGLLMSIGRLVAHLLAAVAVHFAADGRRLAIQSCSDFPVRPPRATPLGNRTALLERELRVFLSHRNT